MTIHLSKRLLLLLYQKIYFTNITGGGTVCQASTQINMHVSIPGEFMSATQKSWRGLGSYAMACCHEASAKMAARSSSTEEEDAIVVCMCFTVWVMDGDALALEGMDEGYI